jgi:Protein of unknown function (DUF3263)
MTMITGTSTLDETDARVLAFAAAWWRRPGARDQAIVDQFGWTPTRYFRRLNALLDLPAAANVSPLLVARLRRVRQAGRFGQWRLRP